MSRREFDQGEAPTDLALNRMIIVLKRSPQQDAALQELIEDQQDIHSPAYHHWLTPEQLAERFGPALSDVNTVTQWLTGNGFSVSGVSKSRMFIEFSGNAAQVKHAFGTGIHGFIVNGERHWANAVDPSIPSALAGVVAGIDSLHNFEKPSQHVGVIPYAATTEAMFAPSPDYTIGSSSEPAYIVSPYDFATIYDLLPLWTAVPTAITGAGQTIAIVGRSDINPADASEFWSFFGLDGIHAPEPKLVITYNGPNPGKNADETEADIDTEWAGAVAPGATINLVTSQSTTTTDGVDLSALYIVDNNLASVLGVSFGACEKSMGAGGVQFYGTLWEQAAAQGISVAVASGDNGAAGCDNPGAPAQSGLQVNGIASTPFNAAVGGTDFNQYNNASTYWNSSNAPITYQSAKTYIPETSWNDSCTNGLLSYFTSGKSDAEDNCNGPAFEELLISTGGSGGESSAWLKPVWQTGTANDNARDLPDVSLFAGNGLLGSYYFYCQRDKIGGPCSLAGGDFLGAGGTSVSAQAFAGIMALVDQKTGSAQGTPGLMLYKLAAQQPAAFHDIPAGSTIAMPCVTGTLNCTTSIPEYAYGILSGYNTTAGYDMATGLGSVDIANLVNSWQTVSFTPTTATLTLNGGAAVNVTHGAAVPLTIGVLPSAATGDAALMVAPGTPGNPGIAAFHLTAGSVAESTSLFPGGSYSVLAHYGGDTTFGGSYSNSVPVVVSPEMSLTFPNLVTTDVNGIPTSFSATSATYGTGYQIFRVDVGDTHASVASSTSISSGCASRAESCPTGKVTLSSPGTLLDGQTVALNSEGYFEIAALTAGTYTVAAGYSGDASYSSSIGNVSFSITKAPTTVSVGVAPLIVQYGNPTQVAADVITSSDGSAPTGTFQFNVDGQPVLGPQPIYESGGFRPNNTAPQYAWADAQTTYPFITIGQHTLSASYSGDVNYAGGASSDEAVSVVQAPASINGYGFENPQGSPVVVGQSATAIATVFGSEYGAAPTGTVTFYDYNVALTDPVSYTSSVAPSRFSALYTTMQHVFTTVGTHQITVGYSGDANYTPATSAVAQSLIVLGPVSVTPAGSVTVTSPGQTGSTSLAITPNGGFTGTASLTCTPDPKAIETTCSLTSGSSSGSTIQVNVPAAGLSASLEVTTTASHQVAGLESPALRSMSRIELAGILLILFPLFKRHRIYLACFFGLAILLSLCACGGGGNSGGGSSGGGGGGGGSTDPGTETGTYNFTVSASTGSGSSLITSTTQVTVLVN